jgi:cytochrome c oxidase assembly protein subunit 15
VATASAGRRVARLACAGRVPFPAACGRCFLTRCAASRRLAGPSGGCGYDAEPLSRFAKLALAAATATFVLIVVGGLVRATDSGLGCPDWPRCYGKAVPPLDGHALIEFGNRALSGIVGFVAVFAAVLAFTRRPFRRDLAWLALSLPAGVVAQAVLGGFTVRQHLAPGFVMGHFALSMVILIGAVALAWRASYEPGTRRRSTDRLGVWSVRALAPLGAVTIFAGTAATAAGPHSGGASGQRIHRLYFKGADTLNWIVHRHATIAAIFGVLAIAVWLLQRQRGHLTGAVDPLTVLCVLLAAQGLVGSVQYELHLPSDMVWVHVGLATATWITVLWALAAAGRLVPRHVRVPEPESSAWPRRQVSAAPMEPTR